MIAELEVRTVDPATGEVTRPAERATGEHDRRPGRGQLPPELLDSFRQHRGEGDAGYWALGDKIADAVAEYAAHGMQARIIRAAALETDLSVGECRKLFETARAVDIGLRAEYGDALTHSHYRAIRYVAEPAKQRAYLALAVESADAFGGRPMPAAKLAARVRADLGLEPPPPDAGELLERAIRAVTNYQAVADGRNHERATKALAELEKVN